MSKVDVGPLLDEIAREIAAGNDHLAPLHAALSMTRAADNQADADHLAEEAARIALEEGKEK